MKQLVNVWATDSSTSGEMSYHLAENLGADMTSEGWVLVAQAEWDEPSPAMQEVILDMMAVRDQNAAQQTTIARMEDERVNTVMDESPKDVIGEFIAGQKDAKEGYPLNDSASEYFKMGYDFEMGISE